MSALLVDDSDDFIEEIIDDSENPDGDDNAENGENNNEPVEITKVSDISAFRAASENIIELLLDLGQVDLKLVDAIIKAKQKTVEIVYKHFPGCLASTEALEKAKVTLEKRGYTPDNTLFATSVCPDEIPHRERDMKRLFGRYLGEAFTLGGMAGIPFAGRTGFASFVHNVPENGHAMVLMAPHIGLDWNNKLGRYSNSMEHEKEVSAMDKSVCSTHGGISRGYCCRAAVGALNYCSSDRPLPNLTDHPEDYQMNYIIQLVNRRKDLLFDEDENTRQADLSKQIHSIAKNMLDKIVNPFFGGNESTLVILTGIQINMPNPFEDFFQPRNFYILKKDGKKEDLFKDTFGTMK